MKRIDRREVRCVSFKTKSSCRWLNSYGRAISLLVACLIPLSGCHKPKKPKKLKTVSANQSAAASQASPSTSKHEAVRPEACTLLSAQEFESVVGEPLTGTTASPQSSEDFVVSQCYFAAKTPSNSIHVAVTMKGDGAGSRSPRSFWDETFHRGKESASGEEGEKDEKKAPPERIADLGDEAFWVANPFGGVLYVLAHDSYIRVAIGGSGKQPERIAKATALSRLILKRL